VHIWDHIHFRDFSAEEKAASWMTQEAYNVSRAERKRTVKIMERGNPFVNDGQHYFRGLEAKTREGSRRKQFNSIDASIAVLDEQSQQDQTGSSDLEAISIVYIGCSSHCLEHAVERGAVDQRAALESVSIAGPAVSRSQPRRLSCRAA
jgi:hypothetical protein